MFMKLYGREMVPVLLLALLECSSAFLAPMNIGINIPTTALRMGSEIVVVSPPGGVGEVAAVKAACLGSTVRWFVVSTEAGSSITISPHALNQISDASGSLELAGASVENLKGGGDAVVAVSSWCGAADGLICSYDGCDGVEDFKAALRLAVQQASSNVKGPKVVVLYAEEDLDDEDNQKDEGLGSRLSSMFKNTPEIPSTMSKCVGNGVSILRHGQLFGLPESSPDFSPLVGGLRREAAVTEEYTMRDVRLDPFVLSGNVMASSSVFACRHAVGQAAALIATSNVPALSEPVSVSSQIGTEGWDMDQWKAEFLRVQELLASGKGTTLFSQEMIVDDVERLAQWLATKWAPAVMRTYDIAAIRIGARPVYTVSTEPGQVEIIWQELVDFQSVVVGKLVLQVTKDGISATRGPGDASKGFGSVKSRPLPGEDVLVRRLSEGASQAIDKGLAKKKLPPKQQAKAKVTPPTPVSTLQSAGSVEETVPSSIVPETGPRTAGARRPTPRKRRGTK